MIALFEQAPCTRTIWVHNDMEREIQAKGIQACHFFVMLMQHMTMLFRSARNIRPAVERIGGRTDNVQVIANYMDVENIRSRAELPLTFDPETQSNVSLRKLQKILDCSGTKFINIGRYAPEKGQERLIRAFDTFWHSIRDMAYHHRRNG